MSDKIGNGKTILLFENLNNKKWVRLERLDKLSKTLQVYTPKEIYNEENSYFFLKHV